MYDSSTGIIQDCAATFMYASYTRTPKAHGDLLARDAHADSLAEEYFILGCTTKLIAKRKDLTCLRIGVGSLSCSLGCSLRGKGGMGWQLTSHWRSVFASCTHHQRCSQLDNAVICIALKYGCVRRPLIVNECLRVWCTDIVTPQCGVDTRWKL